MKKVLITGASGDVGTRLRKLLKGVYPEIRISDIKKPADLRADEEFVQAELANMAEVEKAVAGIDGIVHLGGFSVEGPWETILNSNIVGCYNLFEAARNARRQARHLRDLQSRRRLLSAPPQGRRRRAGASGFALRREQGVRRGARRDVCLQARPAA